MKLLHIDSSILGPHSVSRVLSAAIVEREKSLHPGLEVVYRDLVTEGSPHLSGAHMAAWKGAPVEDEGLKHDLAKGDAYIDEVFAADIIVIGAPMYNFTVPTQLKAWIDRILVAGKTFHYTATGPEGLLPKGKRVIIASARGGVYSAGSPTAALEHHESYLASALSLIGLTDVKVIRAEGVAISPDAREAAIAGARAQIEAIAA